MKLEFLLLPKEERALYINQAGSIGNASTVIMEKDFWVCWMLAILFQSDLREHLVFKGGTSLSKVFGVIDRFSEDIDLSLSPTFLDLPSPGASRNQSNKWMAKAEATCIAIVKDKILPMVESRIVAVLGPQATPWCSFEVDEHSHSPVILFHYPATQSTGYSYLRRSVKLEFGSLTDQQPTGRHPIKPWIADIIPKAFGDWSCEVVALDLERTFWEKATILHAEFHRPADKVTPDRFSRHYADTAALAKHAIVDSALLNHALRRRVVEWKSKFFGSTWAAYDQAKPPTFRLVPKAERHEALRRDYDAMNDMLLANVLSFDTILETLETLQNRINQSGDA